MKPVIRNSLLLLLFALFSIPAWAGDYDETIKVFKNAGESGTFFSNSYGYAVYTKMTQLTIGLQLGGQAYSQIIFFQDKRSFDEFSSGEFEFGAQATAVAITAGASAGASTAGASAGASGGKNDATTVGDYHKGMAVFTVAKGGLMYEASIGGQKYKYTPK